MSSAPLLTWQGSSMPRAFHHRPAILLALAYASTLAAAVFVPKVRWWQSDTSLFLDIGVHCANNGEHTLAVAEGVHFSLTCDDVKGKRAALNFELREPVAQGSQCKAQSTKLHCRLPKLFPHAFDRLSWDVELSKGAISVDYSKWIELEERDSADGGPAEFYASARKVHQYDAAALEAAQSSTDVVVLDLVYPWCTFCESKRAAFASAAAALSVDGRVAFGWADAREERTLRASLNATCSYECTHLLHVRNEGYSRVRARGEWESGALLNEVALYLRPAVARLESETDVEAARRGNTVSVIGAFEHFAADSFKFFDGLAKRERTSFNMSAAVAGTDAYRQLLSAAQDALGDQGGAGFSGILLFREPLARKDGGVVALAASDFNRGNVSRWLRVHSLDDVERYSWEVRGELEAMALPVAHVFVENEAEADAALARSAPPSMHAVRAVAKRLKGEVAFVLLQKTTAAFMYEDFNFDPSSRLPALGLAPSFEYDAPKFAHNGPLTEDAIDAFIERFRKGTLKPSLKSAPAPAEGWRVGAVQVLVGSTLEEEATAAEHDVLLAFHSPYGFDSVNATLRRVAKVLSPLGGSIRVATFDSMANAFDQASYPNVDKYHQDAELVLLTGIGDSRKLHAYKGKPTLKMLLPFLKKRSPAVRGGWQQVKSAIADDNAELSAAKAKAKSEAAAEAAALAELVRSATATEVCCDGDGGVMKKVLREGEGATPLVGSSVVAHYTGRLRQEEGEASADMQGPIFDSSRERGQPFNFKLGLGQVIAGWDRGFASMRKGERALLIVSHEYGYGEAGSPPKIPAKATLEFDVELIDFTHEKAEL